MKNLLSIKVLFHRIKLFLRRNGWILKNLTFRKASNIAINMLGFLSKKAYLKSWPIVLKIDISPLCNLRCTVCVHAYSNGNSNLERQEFNKHQLMTLEQYEKIINEVKGKISAVSLYYLGDPIMHPNLVEMCMIAKKAKINVHISSNFSFSLSDDKIRAIVNSGITHFTVCVDGISQDKYQLTRVGGKIDRVLNNLKKLCKYRDEYKVKGLSIEVQYIKFRHNVDQLTEAMTLFDKIGVDKVTTFWGSLANYTDYDEQKTEQNIAKKKGLTPKCMWPYVYMLIKYNGDVIPCCNFRIGNQYTDQESVIIGNVFNSSVEKVWKSSNYAKVRRLVSDPNKINSDQKLKKSFCYGCPALFVNYPRKKLLSGKDYDYEEIYSLNEKGIPIRKTDIARV